MVVAVAFWNFVSFVWMWGLLSSSPGTSGPSRMLLKIGPKDLVLLRLCSANQGPSGPQWGEMMEHELSGSWGWLYARQHPQPCFLSSVLLWPPISYILPEMGNDFGKVDDAFEHVSG